MKGEHEVPAGESGLANPETGKNAFLMVGGPGMV